MTSKERVQCALAWGRPDRVPIETYLTPEMGEKLTAYFGGRSVSEALGVDFRRVNADLKPASQRRPKPAGAVRFNLEGATRKITTATGATYVEHVSFPMAQIQTMRDIDDWPWGNPDDYDYAALTGKCEKHAHFAICVGGEGTPDILNGLSRLRGMEQVMMDIAARDEVGLAIIEKYVAVKYETIKRSLEAAGGRIDIVRLGEDCGNQNGRMFSKKDSMQFSGRICRNSLIWRMLSAPRPCCIPAAIRMKSCRRSSRWAWMCSMPCNPNRRACNHWKNGARCAAANWLFAA